jgi:hypothetical protein
MVIHVVQDQSTIVIVAEIAVAVGTIGLAIFTARLAHSTRKDIEAQWRPLLVPCFHNAIPRAGIATTGWFGWASLTPEGAFLFSFQNVGKGAALQLKGAVANPPTSTTDFVSLGPLASPILAVEDKAVFRRDRVTIADNRIRVRVDYADLAGNPQHTVAVYRRVVDGTPPWVVESVEPATTRYVSGATWWRRLDSRVKRWIASRPPLQ